MKEWLEQKSARETIKIEAVYLHYIDAVVGDPTDRLRYFFQEPQDHKKAPMHIGVHSYLSNTGNLNLWAYILQYLPEKYRINTPFFSGILDKPKNTSYSIAGMEYSHRSTNWLFPASHEALVGKSSNQIERWAGDMVLADIVRNLMELSFILEEDWTKEIIKKGKIALEQLRECNPTLSSCRKYLDFEQRETTIFGREFSENDPINSCLGISDFTL